MNRDHFISFFSSSSFASVSYTKQTGCPDHITGVCTTTAVNQRFLHRQSRLAFQRYLESPSSHYNLLPWTSATREKTMLLRSICKPYEIAYLPLPPMQCTERTGDAITDRVESETKFSRKVYIVRLTRMSFAFCLNMEKAPFYIIFKILLCFIVAKRFASFEKELSNPQQMLDKYVHLHYTVHRCQAYSTRRSWCS